jgi:hypothetical protein
VTGRRPRRLLAALLGAAAIAGAALAPGPVPARAAPPAGAEKGHPAPDLEAAIDRGVAHLVATQRKDGSWGGTASNLWDIYAPVPGSFHAFQSAVTGLATSALVEVGEGKPGAAEAVRRGADFLLGNHAKARRVSPDTLYNVWTHAYVLEAFARLLGKETDAARKAALLEQSRVAVDLLGRFESVNGGWGYYDFDGSFRQPGQFTTSFTTATCLLALKAAKDRGVEVPRRLVDRGVALVEKLRKPDGSYAYSWDHLYWPQGGINKIKGSLGRTSVCDLALKAWGKEVPPARAEKALADLESFGHFLRIARKYPIPHETWYQNSGYFCFYGYYYASQTLETLPAEKRAPFAKQIASHLLPLQEQDGSWWDYQLYSYHKPYGTAYVLMALGRCR